MTNDPLADPEVTALMQDDAATINDLQSQVGKLRRVLEMIRDNWDCDADSHRYGNPCRCCLAKDALQ